jgi:glycerol-3-phosphate acyltransferase PlsX
MISIAVDVMGGDSGPQEILPAVLTVFQEQSMLRAFLVGDELQIKPLIANWPSGVSERLVIVHTDEVVAMNEVPSVALRTKKRASMRLAIELVRDGKAAACVSAGNTGALMAISRFILKTCAGIDRPAIVSSLPTRQGQTYMLDLGANVDCGSEQLYQFALMGSTLVRALHGIAAPRVALLNIGEETIKGNDRVKQANELMRADSDLNYVGYIEGDAILSGDVDVVVCDGFVGNVALKSIEGVARFILTSFKAALQRNRWTRLLGWLCKPLYQAFLQRMDPGNYNGASLIGLRGVVVKSHGRADRVEFAQALRLAAHEANLNIPRLLDRVL